MTWFAVYETETGKLRSLGTVVADPLPEGLSSVSIGAARPTTMLWNESTLAFDIPAPVPPTEWTRTEFMRRFTAPERIACRNAEKTDPIVEDFFDLLRNATVLVSNDPDVTAGLAYLVSVGLLTQARADEIGSA